MNDTLFLGLVQNAALLLAVAFLFDVAVSRWRIGQSSFWQTLVGFALGAIGITVMLTPWTFGPGIVFDTRSVLLGISGLFFGFFPTAIAMTMTAAFRLYQGGAGAWTGVAVILTSGVIGIAWRHFQRRPSAEISWRDLYLFGIVIHLAMLAMMLTLPWETALRVLSNITLPVILIYPLGTALLGVLMVNRLRREREGEALSKSEEKFRTVFDRASDGILIVDPVTKKFLQGNTTICSMLGYTKEEIENLTINDIHPPEDISHVLDEFEKQLKGENVFAEDLPVLRKDGAIFCADIGSSHTTIGGIHYLIGIFRNITDRKLAEAALRVSEERYRTILNEMEEGYQEVDLAGNFTYFNEAFLKIFGFSRDEMMGTNFSLYAAEEAIVKRVYRTYNEMYKTGLPIKSYEWDIIRKDGARRTLEFYASVLRDSKDLPTGFRGIVRDITDRRLAEEALRESEEKYRNLFENANESIFVAQDGKLVFVNPMTTMMVGYSGEELTARSFIEFIHPDDRGMVIDRHLRRMKGEELSHIYPFRIIHRDGNIRWVELNAVLINWTGKPATLNFLSDITERRQAEEESRRLASVVRHSLELVNLANPDGTMVFLNETGKKMLGISEDDIAQTHIMDVIPEHLRDKVQQEVLPSITKDGYWEGDLQYLNVKTGGLTDVHAITFKIDDPGTGTLQFLANVSQNITERKRAEGQLHHTLDSLRRAFGTTIQVMVSAVERRDPYTAGHQVRSTDIARAIAAEMELSQDKIEAIRMAGPIHDIGKLSIPAEILSKPTKLTEIEFSLIKEHARTGYEMLKDVESPWPLAEIVYQHHERMDGSGYPRNLKGEEILIEARILSVADVVEAMASHRPYRPALGLDAALEEIEKNKGTLYDVVVVDACLRLFREKGLQLIS